jgi:hypothetical protein
VTETRDRHLTPRHRSQRDPKPTNGWLNTHREKQLRDGLRELPELGALAVTTLPGEHLGGEGGARSIPGSRPPLNLAALDLMAVRTSAVVVGDPIGEADLAYRIGSRKQAMRDTLESWCWLAHDEMLDDGQRPASVDQPSVSAACGWLLRHVVWILDQQWVDELALDVALMVRECRAILRERPTYRPRCPKCTGPVHEVGTAWECQACGHLERDERLTLRQVIVQQQPMTVGQLVRAFGWSSKTVESWIQRGNLQPVDDEARPRRYHVLDALRLADAGGAASGPR